MWFLLKGVIYSNELRNIDELNILNELKSQKVTNIEQIRIMKNNILQESGLITVTTRNLDDRIREN